MAKNIVSVVIKQIESLDGQVYGTPIKFSNPSRILMNHVLSFLKPTSPDTIISLVLAVEYATEMMNQKAIYFANGSNFVGPSLHWLIREHTGTTDNTKLASIFVKLLRDIEKNDAINYNKRGGKFLSLNPIASVVNLISALIDHKLESLPPLNLEEK